MPNLFPYTNTHELNLDWVLQVVRDFQTKYTTFDQALADALDAIEAAKTGSLEDMQTALTNALAAINTAIAGIGAAEQSALQAIATDQATAQAAIAADQATAQAAIAADQASALQAVQFALNSAMATLTSETTEATHTILSLYNTLPTSAQDILNRLDILNNIITGNTPGSFVWLQGSYIYEEGVTPPTPPLPDTSGAFYNSTVTSRYMTGAGGRRLRLIVDDTLQITKLLWWYNTPPGGQAYGYGPGEGGVTAHKIDQILRFDSTAFSVELQKADSTQQITPQDVEGHIYIEWVTDFVGQTVIAPKETSTTADVARLTNQLFFLDGILYKALADIDVGDTIVISGAGANCKETTVGYELYNELDDIADALSAANSAESGVTSLQSEVSDLKSASKTNAERLTGCTPITFVSGKVIDLSSDPVSLTPGTNASYMCYSGTCSPGDVYTVNGSTGGTARIYSFLDSSYNRLPPSGTINSSYTNRRVVAPDNAAYLVINLLIADGAYAFKGENLPAAAGEVRGEVTGVIADVTHITGCAKIPLSIGYIDLDSSPVNISPNSSVTYSYIMTACAEGDVFTVTGSINSSVRIYGFLDSSYNILARGLKSAVYDNVLLTAPASAAYLVVNFLASSNGYVIKGEIQPKINQRLSTDASDLKKSVQRSLADDYETMTFYYITSTGEPAYSGNFRMRVYDASQIVKLLKVGAYSSSSDYYCIAFYSSATLSAETFISGVKFKANSSSMQMFENIDIPANAVKCAISSRYATAHDIIIDALTVNQTNEINGQLDNLEEMTYRKPRMKFGAHQGYRGIAPHNTVPAYRLAGQYGWDYAWIAQCKYSASGTWYVMHDDDVRTTTDAATVLPDLESYDIGDLTDEQINQLHVNTGINVANYDPTELYVPTLEEIIEICNLYGMGICFRVGMLPSAYSTDEQKACVDSFIEIIRKYGRQGDIFSGGTAQINNLRTVTGENWEGCLFLGRDNTAQQVITALDNAGITENRSCLIPITTISGKEDVFLLHKNNVKYYAYKETQPTKTELANAAKWGVDIFQNGEKYKIM